MLTFIHSTLFSFCFCYLFFKEFSLGTLSVGVLSGIDWGFMFSERISYGSANCFSSLQLGTTSSWIIFMICFVLQSGKNLNRKIHVRIGFISILWKDYLFSFALWSKSTQTSLFAILYWEVYLFFIYPSTKGIVLWWSRFMCGPAIKFINLLTPCYQSS